MKALCHPMRFARGCVTRCSALPQPRRQRPPHSQTLQIGRLAVQRAARLCREVQSRLRTTEEMGKWDASPVTVADFGAQAIVAYTLQEAQPSGVTLSMVAEESAAVISGESHREMRQRVTELVNQFIPESAPRLSEQDVMDLIDLGLSDGGASGEHWVLDPIDGTRGFVANRQYAVCLGLLSEGQAVMGVLGCPNMPTRKIIQTDGQPVDAVELESYGEDKGCLFTGVQGEGASVGSLWSDAAPQEPISVDTETPLGEVRFMESFESRHSNHEITKKLAHQLGIQQIPLRLDSQAKYGALSRGDAGLFMRFPPGHYREKIWDHCAGAVIVQAAGGCISDAAGMPLDFSQGRFLDIQSGIVAASPKLHSLLISALQML